MSNVTLGRVCICVDSFAKYWQEEKLNTESTELVPRFVFSPRCI